MCYSGTCYFEDYMGECECCDFEKEICKKHNMSTCLVGGFEPEIIPYYSTEEELVSFNIDIEKIISEYEDDEKIQAILQEIEDKHEQYE